MSDFCTSAAAAGVYSGAAVAIVTRAAYGAPLETNFPFRRKAEALLSVSSLTQESEQTAPITKETRLFQRIHTIITDNSEHVQRGLLF